MSGVVWVVSNDGGALGERALPELACRRWRHVRTRAQFAIDCFPACHRQPFFLQECGYQVWQHAKRSPIVADDVLSILPQVVENLDKSFFAVRFDRVSAVEKKFLMAMAYGEPEKPQPLVDVARRMGRTPNSLSMLRRSLIKKGMIYAPSLGMVAYTVPMFGAYMRRVSQSNP